MKHRNTLIALVTALASMAATGAGTHAGGHAHGDANIGQAGQAAEVSRTIQVDMLDTMRFSPSSMSVKQGETIRFVVRNAGKLKHEFVMGTKKDLEAHYEVMKKYPDMEHADDNMLSLAPGQSGELIWKFTKSGTVHVGCLHPGHYSAGMKAAIAVKSSKASHSKNEH